MEKPLTASSNTLSSLISGNRFTIPIYQRNYSWGDDEISDFFSDLSDSVDQDYYFLGLFILTGENQPKEVVDGQQRLLTVTLLAAALYHDAVKFGRDALAERVKSTFLTGINYDTDEESARISLSDRADDRTLQEILRKSAKDIVLPVENEDGEDSISRNLVKAYKKLSSLLDENLKDDPFKRLGIWANFLTDHLYIAQFTHPDSASAFRVFEIVNNRGKDLTTADLLKSYVLSQSRPSEMHERYEQWQKIAKSFRDPSTFVQFIRHVVTARGGYVLPRDLFDALTGHLTKFESISPTQLMAIMSHDLPYYLQMEDPSTAGPANDYQASIYTVLNKLNVISIRPILLALTNTENPDEGASTLLRLVVRRISVGSLGTGNVERRFSEAAKRIYSERTWEAAFADLSDLVPSREQFSEQVLSRALGKNTLHVLQASAMQKKINPDLTDSFIQYVITKDGNWGTTIPSEVNYWSATIGNAVLSKIPRRPGNSDSWTGFQQEILKTVISKEDQTYFADLDNWNIEKLEARGRALTKTIASVWYSQETGE
ncbi:MAG: DUF262 domain-containing protein [Bifidobacterium aquikefiri]|uniref:GmrSD restriction endonucleases N-terminal domain-containing protein n=1 Tax=Bifidobacterium aquikefiri TaxID=1653207 RepID=A0A261GAB1_9BIFI|nr:DUF262 domain-containing protein [Bifidobacterium aquikefiri]OZG68359.1 hypothetical protein BAQU_0174 [Bifidobacterium aquikefiri]